MKVTTAMFLGRHHPEPASSAADGAQLMGRVLVSDPTVVDPEWWPPEGKLTRDVIRALEAGPMIDELVARLVLGTILDAEAAWRYAVDWWQQQSTARFFNLFHGPAFTATPDQPGRIVWQLPQYSQELSAAVAVVLKLRQDGLGIMVELLDDADDGNTWWQIALVDEQLDHRDLCLGICRVALLTVLPR